MTTHWTENDLPLERGYIHYTRTGDGTKPPLVLAHGFSDSGLCWLRAALELETDYDLILPDARGHGLSSRVEPGEDFDMVVDLASLIKGLELDRPVVGGHSMGARVSAELGARYPDLMRGLILEDPAWFDPEPPDEEPVISKPPMFNPYETWLLTVKDKPLEEIIAKCRTDSPTWAEVELQPWAESKRQFDPSFLHTRNGPREYWREVARAIACPTLLITADIEKKALITPETAREAILLNSRIQVIRISGAGHNIRRENFPDYLRSVKDFLAACWS